MSWVICKVSGTFFSVSSHPPCTSSGLVPESPSLVVAASLFSGAWKQCLFCITIASFLHWTVRACFLHPSLLLSPSFFSCIPGSAVRDLRWKRQAPLLPLLSIQEQCRAVLWKVSQEFAQWGFGILGMPGRHLRTGSSIPVSAKIASSNKTRV